MADPKTGRDPKQGDPAKTSARSGLNAPYFDLDASIKVAEAIYSRGGGTASSDQLAAWLDYTTTRSGTFVTRISAANKHFGLIEQIGDQFTLTERGRNILAPVMPEDAANARIDAFLGVQLFARVHEELKGKQLPPEAGLKNLFQHSYKILPDRVLPAVRVFLNSAEQAGFFSATGDRSRLIRPGNSARVTASLSTEGKKDEGTATTEKPRGSSSDGGSIHPSIIGLLRDLPPPGTPWSAQKKKTFLAVFTAAIDWIYPTEEGPQP